ncbi:unnamed protein product [marine sediment metagenome]|uniref:Uncharacterized protein n=1 Tax=marine sediment metagenome TaxID=412755 RepID=X0RZF7_9ZZZZ
MVAGGAAGLPRARLAMPYEGAGRQTWRRNGLDKYAAAGHDGPVTIDPSLGSG